MLFIHSNNTYSTKGHMDNLTLSLRTSLSIQMTLSQGLNQVGKTPTSQSLSKLPNSGLYAKLSLRGFAFLLAPPKDDDLITLKSREKVEPLSLLSYSFLFSLLFSSSPPLFGLRWAKWESTLLPHVNLPLVDLDFLIHLSIQLGFPLNHMLPHVSYGFHLSSCLTRSQLGTCLNVSHSKEAKCPALPSVPRKA